MPITKKMMHSLIEKVEQNKRPSIKPTSPSLEALEITGIPITAALDDWMLNLMGKTASPIESDLEISKLLSALAFISPDVERGSGSFYSKRSQPLSDYWLGAIWSIASLQWVKGKEIAQNWSQQSRRYTEEGFEQAWSEYKPGLPKAISIGSLYKRAKELGWDPLVINAPNQNDAQPNRFTLLGINQLAALPPSEYLIKGILPSVGLAAIYGPSGSGKTFLALDLVMAIASKPDWFGRKVKNVPVVYMGLEGKGGINKRIEAWRTKNNLATPSNVKVILDNFDLMKKADVIELARIINASEMNYGVIVIDTLNQASPTADENASKDMGVILSHLKLLQEATGGLVIIVHHTGKNTAAGLRGHSSLKAALDTNIEVTGGDKRSWSLEKSKDGQDGKSFAFRLESQNLGVDVDGDSITSCTVERDHSVIFSKPEPSGKAQKAALQTIKRELSLSTQTNRCSSGINVKCIEVELAIAELGKTLIATASNKRNNRARVLVGDLTSSGHLASGLEGDEGWIWLP